MRMSLSRFAGAAALALAVSAAFPLNASAGEVPEAPRSSAAEAQQLADDSATAGASKHQGVADGSSPKFAGKGDPGVAAWGYQIMPSCGGLEGLIRQGAHYWEGATEAPGSGKPVECTNGHIPDCFGTVNAVGCNYGPGQRIELSTQVSDFALLAAHEFGHEWYPRSAAGCMNWASAYEVMRPTIC